MRHVLVEVLLLQLFASLGKTDTVYVTDLPLFTSLAPCVQYALSYQVMGLTESACPEAVTALASCACSKDNNFKSLASAISTEVLQDCDALDTEDVTSASAVFSNYCNQGSPAPIPTPSPTLVSQYITDLDSFSDLAPCAQDALSYAVLTLTESLCPIGQSAFESCACTKNQNSLAASERINSEVINNCGSTATEDISSAQAIFAGYCGLGDGTTNFPAPGTISGVVTYYITDLPMFASLAPCAASGVSEAFDALTESYCPSAPNAMASCACFKDQNFGSVSSAIVSSVQYECSSTASADITSAISVFNYYCDAAGGKVTPSGVTNSVAMATGGSAATSGGGNYPSPHATPSSPGASATAGGGSSSNSTSNSNTKSSTNVALIGGIAGGVGAVALIAIAATVWFCRKKRHQPAPLPSVAGSSPNNQDSKVDVELHQYSKMPSPSLKPQPGVYEVPAGPGISEMPNQPAYAQSQGKYSSPTQYKTPSTYTAPSAISSPSMHTVSPVYEAGGRPAVPEMPNNNNMGYYQPPQHQQQQPGYPNQVYEMAPGQQPQQLPPHAITSYNNAGPIYEMYSPDTR